MRSRRDGSHRGCFMIHWCFTEEHFSFRTQKQAPVSRLPPALKLHWTQPQLRPATGVMLSLSPPPLLCSTASTGSPPPLLPTLRLKQSHRTSIPFLSLLSLKTIIKKKDLTSVKQPRQRWVLKADSRQPWATDAYPPSNVTISLLLHPQLICTSKPHLASACPLSS